MTSPTLVMLEERRRGTKDECARQLFRAREELGEVQQQHKQIDALLSNTAIQSGQCLTATQLHQRAQWREALRSMHTHLRTMELEAAAQVERKWQDAIQAGRAHLQVVKLAERQQQILQARHRKRDEKELDEMATNVWRRNFSGVF